MELIEKALRRKADAAKEKAAETPAQTADEVSPDNPSASPPASPPVSPPVAETEAPAQAAAPQRERGSKDPISYSTTRVSPYDPLHWEQNRIVAHSKQDLRAVVFDKLRTFVLQEMNRKGWSKVAVTSPVPNNGKTVTSINLALSMARHPDTTVLLADFDMKRPTVAKYMGLERGPSLGDYFAGETQLSDAMVNPGVDGLVVLPSFGEVRNSSELLSGAESHELARELGERYAGRKIIFDLPPLLTSDDASAFLPAVDCVILVASAGETRSAELRESVKLLDGAQILTSVLTKSHQEVWSYDYSS